MVPMVRDPFKAFRVHRTGASAAVRFSNPTVSVKRPVAIAVAKFSSTFFMAFLNEPNDYNRSQAMSTKDPRFLNFRLRKNQVELGSEG
jgi:hypothetical protein